MSFKRGKDMRETLGIGLSEDLQRDISQHIIEVLGEGTEVTCDDTVPGEPLYSITTPSCITRGRRMKVQWYPKFGIVQMWDIIEIAGGTVSGMCLSLGKQCLSIETLRDCIRDFNVTHVTPTETPNQVVKRVKTHGTYSEHTMSYKGRKLKLKR